MHPSLSKLNDEKDLMIVLIGMLGLGRLGHRYILDCAIEEFKVFDFENMQPLSNENFTRFLESVLSNDEDVLLELLPKITPFLLCGFLPKIVEDKINPRVNAISASAVVTFLCDILSY